MSRIIYNKLLSICSTEYATRFAVDMKQIETLPDYVRRVRIQVKHLSLTEVQKNSGGQIDGSYVSRIENGLVPNPSPEKLIALAKGLGVPTEEIIAVALGNAVQGKPEFEELHLLDNFRALPEDQREYMITISDALAKKYGLKTQGGKVKVKSITSKGTQNPKGVATTGKHTRKVKDEANNEVNSK